MCRKCVFETDKLNVGNRLKRMLLNVGVDYGLVLGGKRTFKVFEKKENRKLLTYLLTYLLTSVFRFSTFVFHDANETKRFSG